MKCVLLCAAFCLAANGAAAHSASDAYLTLTVARGSEVAGTTLHGQWDVALRDLDFVLGLDEDGNGQLTWAEIKHHQAAIERYVYAHLKFEGAAGAACALKPSRQMIDAHADGAYAALFFDVTCRPALKTLTLRYDLFFALDPSHRGIFVMHAGENTSTAVLSPANTQLPLALD